MIASELRRTRYLSFPGRHLDYVMNGVYWSFSERNVNLRRGIALEFGQSQIRYRTVPPLISQQQCFLIEKLYENIRICQLFQQQPSPENYERIRLAQHTTKLDDRMFSEMLNVSRRLFAKQIFIRQFNNCDTRRKHFGMPKIFLWVQPKRPFRYVKQTNEWTIKRYIWWQVTRFTNMD